MHTRRHIGLVTSTLVLFTVVAVGSVYAFDKSTARLRVTVQPVESEIFIDGLHMGDATWDGTLTVPDIGPGEVTDAAGQPSAGSAVRQDFTPNEAEANDVAQSRHDAPTAPTVKVAATVAASEGNPGSSDAESFDL